MKRKFNKKHVQVTGLALAAVAVTVFSMLFPAAFTVGGYAGIIYHGFPAGWMGQTRNGILSMAQATNSLQSIDYIFGFIIDVVFWFFVAFILFSIPQLDTRRMRK